MTTESYQDDDQVWSQIAPEKPGRLPAGRLFDQVWGTDGGTDYYVSTIRLPAARRKAEPQGLRYETTVFRSTDAAHIVCARYQTRDAAVVGHAFTVAMLLDLYEGSTTSMTIDHSS